MLGRWSRKLFVAVVTATLFVASVSSAPATAALDNGQRSVSYVLVDHDTGNVIEASNETLARPPASVTKLLTALVAVAHIPPEQKITISAEAARMPPMKIGLAQGEVWTRDDLLHSLLMVSANDAAVALAEAASGSLESFAKARSDAAVALGLKDDPILRDPAGLDDAEFSYQGGDRISARDIAIIARAALQEPTIRSIVAKQRYEFVGGDGERHILRNHNKMLTNFPGAIGMKPGYTSKARNTMVAAATRDGRTMIAVVLGADGPYAIASDLLNRGFSTSVAVQTSNENLPLATLASQLVVDQPVAVELAEPATDSRKAWARVGGSVFIAAFVVVALYLRRREIVMRSAAVRRPRGRAKPADAFD